MKNWNKLRRSYSSVVSGLRVTTVDDDEKETQATTEVEHLSFYESIVQVVRGPAFPLAFVAIGLLLLLCAAIPIFLLPREVASVINYVHEPPGRGTATIVVSVAWLGIFALITAVLYSLSWFVLEVAASNFGKDFKSEVARLGSGDASGASRISRLRMNLGDLLEKTAVVKEIVFRSAVFQLWFSGLALAGVVQMFVVQWKLTLVFCACLAAGAAVFVSQVLWLLRKERQLSHLEKKEREGAAALGRKKTPEAQKALNEGNDEGTRLLLAINLMDCATTFSSIIVVMLVLCGLLYWGAHMVADGRLSNNDLVLFFCYFAFVLWMVWRAYAAWTEMQEQKRQFTAVMDVVNHMRKTLATDAEPAGGMFSGFSRRVPRPRKLADWLLVVWVVVLLGLSLGLILGAYRNSHYSFSCKSLRFNCSGRVTGQAILVPCGETVLKQKFTFPHGCSKDFDSNTLVDKCLTLCNPYNYTDVSFQEIRASYINWRGREAGWTFKLAPTEAAYTASVDPTQVNMEVAYLRLKTVSENSTNGKRDSLSDHIHGALKRQQSFAQRKQLGFDSYFESAPSYDYWSSSLYCTPPLIPVNDLNGQLRCVRPQCVTPGDTYYQIELRASTPQPPGFSYSVSFWTRYWDGGSYVQQTGAWQPRFVYRTNGPSHPIAGVTYYGSWVQYQNVGQWFTVDVTNLCGSSTTLHWHGFQFRDNTQYYDGTTWHQPVINNFCQFRYRMKADAPGTYWYHAHDTSWPQGTYGMVIVRDQAPNGVIPFADQDLRDVPLMLGEAIVTNNYLGGLTVNGIASPYSTTVTLQANQPYRFRIVNAGYGSAMKLWLVNSAQQVIPITVFEYDGFLVTPKSVSGITGPVLNVANRLSFTATLAPGNYRLYIEASPENGFAGWRTTAPPTTIVWLFVGYGNSLAPQVQPSFGVVAEYLAETPFPTTDTLKYPWELSSPAVPLPAANYAFTWELRKFWPSPSQVPPFSYPSPWNDFNTLPRSAGLGSDLWTTTWDLDVNTVVSLLIVGTVYAHPIHLHGNYFTVTSVKFPNDPVAQSVNLKADTITVPARANVTVLINFDHPGAWMMHCHMAEHTMSLLRAFLIGVIDLNSYDYHPLDPRVPQNLIDYDASWNPTYSACPFITTQGC